MSTPRCVNRRVGGKEFVVVYGASMHMVSERDLNFAELETMRISRNLTKVMTAKGERQTREEAPENVKDMDFLTVMLLEETPAVLFLGKLCEDHGYTAAPAVKNHISPKKGKRIDCNVSNCHS